MRIVQIVTQMEAGGAQRVAMLLHEAFQKRGYESEVWFLYLKRPTYINHPNVRVLLEHSPSALDYLKISMKLRLFLQDYYPNILITHTHYSNLLGQFLGRLCGISKRIAVQHNPLNTYPKIACWADYILGTTGFYSTNVAVSKTVLDSSINYNKTYKKSLTKIYNGIPCPKTEHCAQEIFAEWELPQTSPLLINVGRLAHQKNQAILIQALKHIPNAHLLLVGDGELRESLQNQVLELQLEQRVHFLNELTSQQVFALLSISKVFVFPSLFEAMGIAAVEAMASGLPIIASDIPGLREAVGDAGIFVPSDSAEQIAKAVQLILDSPELANDLRQRSLERARDFSLEKMVDSYERLFS